MYKPEMSAQTPTSHNYGAHEFLGMTEALHLKAGTVETLSALSRQTKDTALADLMRHHAQSMLDHYNAGVNLLKGQAGTMGSWMPNLASGEPRIGLSNPTYPAPDLNAQNMSDHILASTILQLYKYHATGWLQIALECSNPQFRSYLMEGTLLSDRMAYDVFMYMNQRGYYQVPQVPENLFQSITNAYASSGYPGYTPTVESAYQPQ